MTDKPQEPRDLIQICTDIYYECETIKRLDELTDEALDWHNKQIAKARIDEVKKARDDYTTRVPDVFDRDIYQVKYFQHRNEELTAELSQTLKEHKEAEL